MEKSRVVYKRRTRKPLSELPWNASDATVDPESQVSLLASDDDGTESITPVKKKRKSWSGRSESKRTESITPSKKNRKSWPDRSESKRQTRSNTTLGKDFNLEDMACKLVGTLSGKKDKTQADSSEGSSPRDQPDKEPDVVDRYEVFHSPIEFVREKRAMFAEIDSFELESEEESSDDKDGESMEGEGDILESSKPESTQESLSTFEAGTIQPEGDR